MKQLKKSLKLVVGLLISAVFMYFAFEKVNFSEMMQAFKKANYWYLIPSVAVMFVSYWLRAFRWRYLLAPVRKVPNQHLFSALLIGYMANSFLPAHLGEFIRAYLIGKREDIPSSCVFASIVIERIIDVMSLILVMGLTIIVFPFPDWVRRSGFIFLAVVVVLFALLVVMKKYRHKSMSFLSIFTRFLPQRLRERVENAFHSLLDGIEPLKKKNHYLKVFLLTALIWACYVASFYVVFFAFGFIDTYSLNWLAALVLLVMTTIGILVPSSPGYVGVYHFLCQLGLGLFSVPESESLSYAFVMHGINFFPIIIVGLILLGVNHISLKKLQDESSAMSA